MSLLFNHLLAGISVGLFGGRTAGLLGVSPGGSLVLCSVLLLGAEQHVAQSLSLVAQIPPASVAGIRRYWERGCRVPLPWLVPLTFGFIAGGVMGAFAAGDITASVLRWSYVGYLTASGMLLIVRRDRQLPGAATPDHADQIHWASLLTVGTIAGFASGFFGIGGGLAVTVGLSIELKVPQHQAQLVSLVMAIIPTTIPAAWVYWHQRWPVSWPIICGVVLGLLGGTDLGAYIANRLGRTTLRRLLIGVVSSMAMYMTYTALR